MWAPYLIWNNVLHSFCRRCGQTFAIDSDETPKRVSRIEMKLAWLLYHNCDVSEAPSSSGGFQKPAWQRMCDLNSPEGQLL